MGGDKDECRWDKEGVYEECLWMRTSVCQGEGEKVCVCI